MSMVLMIDRPDFQVSMRDDIAAQHMVCTSCDGRPMRYRHLCGDLWRDGISIYSGPYVTCMTCCGRGVIRKTASTVGQGQS
jgi:hypothetical protein